MESNHCHFHVKEIRYHYANETGGYIYFNWHNHSNLCPCQESNLTPSIKSRLPTPVCYKGYFSRVDRSRTYHLSRPRRASHPENTTRIIVNLGGIEPPLFESKSNVITVIPQVNVEEGMGFEPIHRLRQPAFKTVSVTQNLSD